MKINFTGSRKPKITAPIVPKLPQGFFGEPAPLKLSDPRVQKAKRNYDDLMSGDWRGRPRKQNISFEDWFEMFKANCITLQAMGEHAGITRERVRQIYNAHFRDLFEGQSKSQRRLYCTAERIEIEERRKEINFLKSQPVFRAVIAQAQKRGLKTELVWRQYGVGPSQRRPSTHAIRINGKLCSIQTCKKMGRVGRLADGRKSGPLYARLNFSGSMVTDHAVVFAWIDTSTYKTVFVIPTERLVEQFGEPKYWSKAKNGTSNKTVYFRDEKTVKRDAPWARSVDLHDTEKAWHLMEEAVR